MIDFHTATPEALNAWYESTVGYRPQVDDPSMSDADLRRLCTERAALDIAVKWVAKIGGGFHPDNWGRCYTPALTAAEIKEYDTDMEALFGLDCDPYAVAVEAMELQ